MRYISLIIGCILAFTSCNEVKVSGNGDGASVLTAGFRDTVVTVFENIGTDTLYVDFSQVLQEATYILLSVVEEEDIQEGKDYFLPVQELTVAAGEKSAAFCYALVDDNVSNDARSFSVRLVSVNGGVVDAQASKVRVKVLDDESDVAVGFKNTEVKVAEREPGSTASTYFCQIPVEIYGNMHKPVQFEVVVLPAEGPNAAEENVHFRVPESVFVVNDTSESVIVPVEIIDDNLVNADRVFVLDIVNVVGAEVYTEQKRCIVTIENNDMGIYFGEARVEAYEDAGKVKVPVKLTPGAADTDIAFVLSVTGLEEGVDYDLTKEWTIPAGQEGIDVEMELLHKAGIEPDRMLTLGFASAGDNVMVFEEQPTCEVNILDVDTELDFKYAEYGIKDSRGNIEVPVVLNGEALAHDVSFTVNLNLPEGVEATADESLIIPAGETSATVLVKVSRMGASHFTMEIQNVQGATASGRTGQISQFGDISASQGLTVAEYSSQAENETAPNGFATAAVDGDPNTFWHSRWAEPSAVLPQYIIVQVPDHIHVGGVDVIRRISASNNSDNKLAEVFLSEDKSSWDLQGVLEWEKPKSVDITEHLRHMDFNHLQKGGYIKINVTDGFRNNAQIGEVIIYGYAE